MSEEEIIKVLKCEDIFDTANEGILELLNKENGYDLNILKQQAIQGLLDLYNKEKALAENHRIAFEKQTENLHEMECLYNKEKEKNEELENADLTTVYMNGYYDGEKKWKDKIKEKIQQVKDSKENYTFKELTSEDIRRTIITNLQDLLEEDNK